MSNTPRVRETDTRQPSFIGSADYNPDGSYGGGSEGYTARKKSGYLKRITDYPVKGYYRRLRNGEIILNPVEIIQELRESEDSNWSFGTHPIWGSRNIYGSQACEHHQYPIGVNGFNDSVESGKDLALIEAYAKMNSPDVLFSVFYAERGKTLTMLRRPMGGAATLLGKIFTRRANLISRGYTLARAGAQAWLEYRFGWRPLMYDVAGIAKAAGNVKPKTGTLLTKRGGIDRHFYLCDELYLTTVPGLTSLRGVYSWDLSAQVRSGVLYTYKDLTDEQWKAKCFGLGLNTVPSHLWEVVPYSFVVDYWIRVGQWLAAITPDPDIIVHGNWVSTKRLEVNKTSLDEALVHINGLGPPYDFASGGGFYKEILQNFTREINRSLPSVPPIIGKPLDWQQNLDIVTLALNLVNKNLGQLRL